MNKYEKAFENICSIFDIYDSTYDSELKLLNELVERATPKNITVYDYLCPVCKENCRKYDYYGTTEKLYNYCPNCGQALDWSVK